MPEISLKALMDDCTQFEEIGRAKSLNDGDFIVKIASEKELRAYPIDQDKMSVDETALLNRNDSRYLVARIDGDRIIFSERYPPMGLIVLNQGDVNQGQIYGCPKDSASARAFAEYLR
jgi:hypothetical protein